MEVLLAAAETLGRHLGVNRAGYAEVDPDGTLVIGRDWTDGTVKHGTGRRPIASFGQAVVDKLERGETERFDDALTDPRVEPSHRPAFEEMSIVAILTVPLVKGGRLVGMLSVHQKHARVWTDAEVQLVQDVAERTWAALERARAELALRSSEEQFRQLANNLPALCWMANADGRPFWFNRRWCEYFGLADGEAADWDSQESLAADVRSDVMARWNAALAAQEPFEMTLPLHGKDGLERTFLTRVEPMRDGAGRVARWFGMNTDVTEQIESERVRAFLLRLEDRLRPLTDPGDIVEVVSEELGRHLGVNRGGYGEVEGDEFVIERPWTDGTVQSAAGRYPMNSFDPAIVAVVQRGEAFVSCDVEADTRIGEAHKGAYSSIEMRSIITQPLLKHGQMVAIMTVNQKTPRLWTDAEVRIVAEVAERAWASLARARAEASLRESQALLAAFMKNAPVGMYLKDADGRYLLANSGMERLFRRPAAEAIGLTAEAVYPADMAAIAAEQDAGLRGRAQVTYQSQATQMGLDPDHPVPIRGRRGAAIGAFVIDIDEQEAGGGRARRSREASHQSEKLVPSRLALAGGVARAQQPAGRWWSASR
jgi:PAS domain S-box-containing protein